MKCFKRGSVTARVPPPAVGFLVRPRFRESSTWARNLTWSWKIRGPRRPWFAGGECRSRRKGDKNSRRRPSNWRRGPWIMRRSRCPTLRPRCCRSRPSPAASEGRFLGLFERQRQDRGVPLARGFSGLSDSSPQATARGPRRVRPAMARPGGGIRPGRQRCGTTGRPAPRTPRRQGPGPQGCHGPAAGGHGSLGPGSPAGGRAVEVHENGKMISITDNKDSGITVTVTETHGGRKRTTEVKAANATELARKNPDANRMYRQYYHPRAKTGKGKW